MMMTKIDPKDVQRLRSESGAGVMDCKRALEETGGDYAKALALIKERGIQSVAKKSDREAKEGLVASYIHRNGRIRAPAEPARESDLAPRGVVRPRERARGRAGRARERDGFRVAWRRLPPARAGDRHAGRRDESRD